MKRRVAMLFSLAVFATGAAAAEPGAPATPSSPVAAEIARGRDAIAECTSPEAVGPGPYGECINRIVSAAARTRSRTDAFELGVEYNALVAIDTLLESWLNEPGAGFNVAGLLREGRFRSYRVQDLTAKLRMSGDDVCAASDIGDCPGAAHRMERWAITAAP